MVMLWILIQTHVSNVLVDARIAQSLMPLLHSLSHVILVQLEIILMLMEIVKDVPLIANLVIQNM